MARLADSLMRVKERATALARLNAELAQLEVKRKATRIGIGVGLVAAAGLLLLFSLGFAFAGAAAAIDTQLPLWASLLVVAGAIVLVAGGLGAAAAQLLRGGGAPVPTQAVEEGRKTIVALRGDGRP